MDERIRSMRIYRVGGSVRDELLGLPIVDRDWVVVGETPGSMQAAGFRPVGKDFPVFLHPDTQEEYALARTERKTRPGYKGFAVHFEPGVTLEEDLARRDLTINAMAIGIDGELVDPFHGRDDLKARVFRHVTGAFGEDPLRILRVARFSARFTDFGIAAETLALMRRMVAAGEVAALVPERVWQELSRGLMEALPSRMLTVLEACDALAVLLPAFASLPATRRGQIATTLDRAAARAAPLAVRFALWLADCGAEAARAAAAGLRAPNDCRDLAVRVADEVARARPATRTPIATSDTGPHDGSSLRTEAGQWLADITRAPADALLDLLTRNDAWRRTDRIDGLLRAQLIRAEADDNHPGVRRLLAALAAANAVDQAAIAARHKARPLAIRDAIQAARLQAIDDLPGA